MPNLPLSGFADCPVDIKEANKLALSYCTDNDMDKLFTILRDMKGAKKSDLEEAIFDFEHKQYKSCVLVLFGLIDDMVYIGVDLPEEYAHSNYTNTLKGANAKAKYEEALQCLLHMK